MNLLNCLSQAVRKHAATKRLHDYLPSSCGSPLTRVPLLDGRREGNCYDNSDDANREERRRRDLPGGERKIRKRSGGNIRADLV
jgi:hypothetical protein